MRFSEIPLPTNKKFGLFFAIIFAAVGLYFQINEQTYVALVAASCAVTLAILAILNSSYLTPLNKAWMFFGYAIGKVVSPLVMLAIFIFIFLPIGIFMKLIRRDELRLRYRSATTYWREREKSPTAESFNEQF